MKSTIRVLVSTIAAVITYVAALLVSFWLIPSGTGLWRLMIDHRGRVRDRGAQGGRFCARAGA